MAPEVIRKPLVGYVRVSTAQQGRTGLGIEAQREALSRFASSEGYELVRVFTEVETGVVSRIVLELEVAQASVA